MYNNRERGRTRRLVARRGNTHHTANRGDFSPRFAVSISAACGLAIAPALTKPQAATSQFHGNFIRSLDDLTFGPIMLYLVSVRPRRWESRNKRIPAGIV